jgi:hypothetical protein
MPSKSPNELDAKAEEILALEQQTNGEATASAGGRVCAEAGLMLHPAYGRKSPGRRLVSVGRRMRPTEVERKGHADVRQETARPR